MRLNTVTAIDCVEGMRKLADKYVDLTVTSPPYDNLRKYNGFELDIAGIISELYRVTKDGGVVVWVVGDATVNGSETGTSFRQALAFIDAGFRLHDTMIYEKANPVPSVSRRYQPSFEYMFVFSKGAPRVFNPIRVPKKYIENRSRTNFNRDVNGIHIKGASSSDTTRLKKNVWTYSVGRHHTSSDDEAFEHPAVFPEKLAEDHILSWSNPGDVVLDIFAGSGTTLKMAMLNERNYIGFDLSEDYVNIAQRRLNKYTPEGQCYCGEQLVWQNDFDDYVLYSCFKCGNDVEKPSESFDL